VPPDAKGGQAYKEADQEDDHRQRPCPEPAARSTHFASCAEHGAILGIVTHRGRFIEGARSTLQLSGAGASTLERLRVSQREPPPRGSSRALKGGCVRLDA
jgi:hypothetical protein